MISLAIAAVLLPQGPADLTAPVTLTAPAAPVARIVAAISESTKTALTVSPQLAGEIVAIDVKGIRLGDVLTRIATVTSAEWVAETDHFRLVPAVGLRNRQEQVETAARVQALRKTIETRLKAQAEAQTAAKSGGLSFRGQGFAVGAAPDDKVFNTLLRTLDLSALAALGPNDRVVFSTQPTRMQRPLTGNVSGAIAAFVAEHNKTASNRDALQELDKTPQGEQMPQFVRDMVESMTKPIGQVNKALLVASRSGLGGFEMFNLELKLYDAKGSVAFQARSMLSSSLGDIQAMVKESSQPAPAKETPIEWTPESKAIEDLLRSGSRMLNTEIDPSVKAKLLQPNLYDPLSFRATEELFAVARKRGLPCIANIPDDAVNPLSQLGRKPTVESVERSLQGDGAEQALVDPQFLLVRPRQPARARRERLDRQALATLLAASNAKGVPSLDDVAAYALRAPSPMDGGLGQTYVGLFAPGAFTASLGGFTNWDALRIYGSMDPIIRQRLSGGGSIPFATLPLAVAGHVRHMLFSANSELEVEQATPNSNGLPSWMKIVGVGQDKDYRTEPTEAMPNGLPADGYMTLSGTAEPFAVTVSGKGDQLGTGPLGVLGADEMAMFRMFREDKMFAAVSSQLPTFDRLKIGERRIWKFTFVVAPSVAMHTALHDNQLPKNGQTYSATNLPADFQKLIDQRFADVKKSPLGALGALMGGMGKAPPP